MKTEEIKKEDELNNEQLDNVAGGNPPSYIQDRPIVPHDVV